MTKVLLKKIGFWQVFALVTGSQIGSGVFMLPATLAPYGVHGLISWLCSGLGAVLLSLVFAKLCSLIPKTGGPHAYVEHSFGRNAGFFTGWTYWIVSWVSNVAVITTSIGYIAPILGVTSKETMLVMQIILLLIITWVNLRGVQSASVVEFFLAILKLVPLALLPLSAFMVFNIDNFASIPQVREQFGGDIAIISKLTLLTLWGFIGLESGTTPAGSVSNPTKTIPKAVAFGTLTVAVVYFLNSFAILGSVNYKILAVSKAPYVEVANVVFGSSMDIVISIIASIVCVGTLNAWILASGQIALGSAEDGLLPKIFAKKNKKGAPYCAILMSMAGIIPILILTNSDNLAAQLNQIIDFSVTSFLVIYALCCLSLFRTMFVDGVGSIFYYLISIAGLLFCGWVIFNTTGQTLLISSLFTFSGLPIWLYMRLCSSSRSRVA